MFVRWQSRERNRAEFGSWSEPDTHWRAILAENTRVGSADGKPRQRHIAYLAGFTESRAKVPTQRCHLWDAITAKLDQLGDAVAPDVRAKIEAAIAVKLPRPTPAEYLDCARKAAAKIGWDHISAPFRAALVDEADRWQGREGDAIARIRNAWSGANSATVRCSICGRTNDQAQIMVAGQDGAICNECVEAAAARIKERQQQI